MYSNYVPLPCLRHIENARGQIAMTEAIYIFEHFHKYFPLWSFIQHQFQPMAKGPNFVSTLRYEVK